MEIIGTLIIIWLIFCALVIVGLGAMNLVGGAAGAVLETADHIGRHRTKPVVVPNRLAWWKHALLMIGLVAAIIVTEVTAVKLGAPTWALIPLLALPLGGAVFIYRRW